MPAFAIQLCLLEPTRIPPITTGSGQHLIPVLPPTLPTGVSDCISGESIHNSNQELQRKNWHESQYFVSVEPSRIASEEVSNIPASENSLTLLGVKLADQVSPPNLIAITNTATTVTTAFSKSHVSLNKFVLKHIFCVSC
ncbi:unnamed protein product [Protopolystoma xenopodis]|uniref:Uncharacterized protein n=1 Tax=Protopolystoma xenopodis TaxID=117903 RepID=A0A3S5FD82_9PLAT|nr:unnamed protein product [Protopolystoma xenopodis]